MKENLIFKKSKKQLSHLTYNLKSRKGKRIFCLFLLAGTTSFLIFLAQKPDNSFASTLDECKSGQDVYVQQACDAWYSGHDDWTTMTYEWISNDSSCSHDTVTISSSDSGMVGKYLCSMAFTGNNDARANNVTYTTDHIDTGSPYFNVDSSTTMTNQATDKNSWSTATAVPVNVDADALKGSVNPNIIGNETICAEQTMTSNLTISDGGGGHKTPSISPLCVEVENKPKPTTPKINSDQPEPVKTTDSYHYQEVFYSTTTFGPINYNFSMGIEKLFDSSNPDPKYRNLSHQLGSGITQSFDFKNSENPADFYPGEENPITTSSLAAVSAAEGAFNTLVSTLKNSVVDDLKICGKSNLEDTAQIMKSSWNIFKKFVHNYRILKQNAGEDTSTTNYDSDASADAQGDIMSTILQKLLQNAALFGQAAIYTLQDKDVQSEIGKGGNAFLNFTKCNGKIAFDNLLNSTGVMSDVMNNKPTPVISEGYVDINPGETQPITSFATIPSESITYTFYKKYTKSYTTTIEYTDGVLTDDYKTLDDITSELIGYEKTYTDNGHKIKSDTRYVRRLGNIYGTEFRTRLLSVDKNTFTGTVTPPGSGAYTEATVTNPPENLDNNQTNDRPVDAVDKKYDDTIFAGSDNNDSIKATYNHAATAKADENTTSKGCEAMDDYDIPWYIDGDLRKSGVDISTSPFRLAVNNQECINPKDPLLTSEGESYTYTIDNTADEHSSGNAIALGTKDREFMQGGHIASKYELQADKSLKETGELKANVKFKVSRPWNYNLSIKKFAINQPGGLFVTDGSVTLSAEVINKANSEGSNPSYSPKDTRAEIYKILVEDTNQRNDYNATLDSGNGIGGDNVGFIDLNDDKGNGIKYAQKKATGEEPGSSGVKTSDSIDYSYGDDKVGQLLCFYLRVNHTDSNKDTNNNGGYVNGSNGGTPNNNYLYSKLTCATLIGVPHAEFWGGSVFSTGNIETKIYQHTRLGGSRTFIIGSWADYSVIGKNNIRGLASGKTIGQEKVDDNYSCEHHPLTINNKTCEDKDTPSVDETYLDATDPTGTAISTIGHNQSIVSTNTKTRLLSKYRKVNGIEDHDPSSIKPTTANAHGQDSQYYCYTNGDFTTLVNCSTTTFEDTNNAYRYTYQDGDLDIGNLTLQHSTTHVIYATRDININGNIKYDTYDGSGYTKLSQIPQYIIIADGNINIDDSVTEINAWLIADADNNGSGTIDTCTFNQPSAEDYGKELIKGPKDYNANVCNDQLVVKGPVFANKLQLSRTQFGAAEKFDINPLSYYWAYAQAKESGRSTVVYQRYLPPRY